MQRFIRQLILFFALPVLILTPIDFLLSNHLKKTSLALSEYEVWNDIYYNKISPEISIYGSSRAWVHINPLIIEDTLQQTSYNFGIDGHNFWLQYYRHKKLLEHTTPKLIIHSVDINTLAKRKELYNLEQFLPYMLWNREIYSVSQSYTGFKTIDYLIPMVRYYGKGKFLSAALQAKKNSPVRTKGFLGQNITWNDDLEKAKTQLSSFTAKQNSTSVELLKTYINECKQLKIDLILVYTPEYIDGQNFIENRKEVLTLLQGLAKEYNLPFLDYSNHYLSMDNQYFYNAMHLNAKGAEKFSQILASDIKKLRNISNH